MNITKAKLPKLIRYDAMVLAIEEARSVDEVKEIRDQAKALETYAKQALDRDQERKVIEIRIRAERRVGQLLRETAKAKGTDTGGRRSKLDGRRRRRSNSPATLAEHGISKDQSSDWQKLATILRIFQSRFEFFLRDAFDAAPDPPRPSGSRPPTARPLEDGENYSQ